MTCLKKSDNMLKLYFTFRDLVRIIIRADIYSKKKIGTPGKGRVLRILGNGKSLNNTSINKADNVDYMVVNRHVLADNYLDIKPRYYVLADPHFFTHEEGLEVMRRIDNSTCWDMSVFIPFRRRKSVHWNKEFKNERISLKTYNAFFFFGYEKIAYFLYEKQLAMPMVQNVLVAAIMLGIQMNYDVIELYGVEHNWLKNIYVGEDNLVYLLNEHFYDKEKVSPLPQKTIQHKEEYPLYLNISHYARMFQSYWEIKNYLKRRNLNSRIINKTKDSYIDAFERG